MKRQNHVIQSICAILILILIITDTKTASDGAKDGIDMCSKVVLPSLFPFFVVTSYLNSLIAGNRLPAIQYLTKRLHIPDGGESILLLGLTGGYPVGAKLIADQYHEKKINKENANILLGYCNNAGPAFIFGIAGAAFESPMIPLALWIIHIVSAVVTGFLLPKPQSQEIYAAPISETSLQHAVRSSVSACASVCGWVITFKILLSYLFTWLQDLMLCPAGIVITGVLELSNGCIAAAQISNPAVRFILYTAFFAFGGLCVLLQTTSVTGTLGKGLYMHGKLIQTGVSLILACICSKIIFSEYCHTVMLIIIIVLSIIIITFVARHAKNGGNPMKNPV